MGRLGIDGIASPIREIVHRRLSLVTSPINVTALNAWTGKGERRIEEEKMAVVSGGFEFAVS